MMAVSHSIFSRDLSEPLGCGSCGCVSIMFLCCLCIKPIIVLVAISCHGVSAMIRAVPLMRIWQDKLEVRGGATGITAK